MFLAAQKKSMLKGLSIFAIFFFRLVLYLCTTHFVSKLDSFELFYSGISLEKPREKKLPKKK